MITGNFWDRPGRSYRAAFLEHIDQSSAYIMVFHYPKEGELINHRGVEVCRALIVTSEDEMNWTSCEPPYMGFYISS